MKIENPDKKPSPTFDPVGEAERRRAQAEQQHPFVLGMANVGAILGRDIGVLALRVIEKQGDTSPILYWAAEFVPEAIKAQVPPEMLVKLHGAMIVPANVALPPFRFDDPTRSASRTLADGSRLLVFEKAAAQDNDAAA